MRAVWSFWSVPHRARSGFGWASERYHLLAWVLSFMTARQHASSTALVTDTPGKRLLVDGLGLPFDSVSTALDALPDHRADVWMLGKLYAYRMQTSAFVHVDADVFLWEPLPHELLAADMFAQNPEYIDLNSDTYYRPYDLDRALRFAGGWQPPAWVWALEHRTGFAINCGILGANDLPFIQRFADDAIRFVEDPANQAAWQLMGTLSHDNIVLEQYMLGAYVDYSLHHPDDEPGARKIGFLFDSMGEAFEPGRAEALGYTHLIGGAKQHPNTLAKLERRVARDFPHYYARALKRQAWV